MKKETLDDILFTLNQNTLIEIATTDHRGAYSISQHHDELTELDYKNLCDAKRDTCFLNGINKNVVRNLRAKNQDVIRKNIISFDLDLKDSKLYGAEFVAKSSEDKLEIASKLTDSLFEKFEEAQLVPWLVVFSGNGLHLHYRLEEPIAIVDNEKWGVIYEKFLAKLQPIIGDDYPLDPACKNVGRIFRLPGTWNVKKDCTPAETQVLRHTNSFADDIIEQLSAPAWGAAESIDHSDLVSSLSFDNDAFEQIKNALQPGPIFKYFNVEIHNSKNVPGQWWCSSPWRRSGRPISESSPSFVYTIEKKQWFCHSSGKGGDLFQLIGSLHTPELSTKGKEQFKTILKIAEKITGIENKRKAPIVAISTRMPPSEEELATLIANIPLDTPKIKLRTLVEPILQKLAASNDSFDAVCFEELQVAFKLNQQTINGFAKYVKELRKEARKGASTSSSNKAAPRQSVEFDAQAYFSLFNSLGIAHDEISREPVKLVPATQIVSRSGILPFTITPARLEYWNTRRMARYLKGTALASENRGLHAHCVESMLEVWLKDHKNPAILIPEVTYEGSPSPDILETPLGKVVKALILPKDGDTLSHKDICEIFLNWLTTLQLRIYDSSIRPTVPILVSSTENIGKDVLISTIIGWFNPYVKKVSFGKGSQEKELQYAFGTSLVQHIEEAERMRDMNPAFIKSLISGDFSDTTLKGDNATTRLCYRGCAIGSANSCDFMTSGTDNSRFTPIVIEGIERSAYTPSLDVQRQIYAQSLEASKKGVYGLSLELQEKLNAIRAFHSQTSEGHGFLDIFRKYLLDALHSCVDAAIIVEEKAIAIEMVDKMGIFEKIREERPEYRTVTNVGFRKLLKEAGAYRQLVKKRLRSMGNTPHRFISLSSMDINLIGNSNSDDVF